MRKQKKIKSNDSDPIDAIDMLLADLIQGPLKGKKFKFHHTDSATGERKVMELGG